MSTDSEDDDGPVCGCLSCTRPRVDIVTIPGKGRRAVCQPHLDDLEVNGGAE